MKTYYINQYPNPPIPVQIEQDPPPCLLCDRPVGSLSMGGPLICVPCDLGQNPDGTKITPAQYLQRKERVRVKILAFQDAAAARAAKRGQDDPAIGDPAILIQQPLTSESAIRQNQSLIPGVTSGSPGIDITISNGSERVFSSTTIDNFVKYLIVQAPTKEDPPR